MLLKSISAGIGDGVYDRLSHLPDGSGSLLQEGLGGSLGAGTDGEYLDSKGGGGK